MHRHGGRELLHGELAAVYDAFETPRSVRGQIELLDHAGALDYLAQVRHRTLEVLDERGPRPGAARARPAPRAAAHRDDAAGDAPRRPRGARARRAAAHDDARRLGRRPRRRAARWAPRTAASPTTTSSRAMRGGSTASASPGGRCRSPSSPATATPTPLRCTSPGTTRTPSPARAARASPPRPSGSTRPASGCWATPVSSGSGPPPSSPGTRLRRPPLPRVLRGLLRLGLPRPARRRLDHASTRRRPSFRNWDLPQRRQIFAGLRLVEGQR